MMPSNIDLQRQMLDPQSALSIAGLPETTPIINIKRLDDSQEPQHEQHSQNNYASEETKQGKQQHDTKSDIHEQE